MVQPSTVAAHPARLRCESHFAVLPHRPRNVAVAHATKNQLFQAFDVYLATGKLCAEPERMRAQAFRTSVEHIPQRLVREHSVAVLLNAQARKVNARVIRALSHVVPKNDLFLSHSPLDARRIAQHVVERGYEAAFLGGGDGTLMCFVNEILSQAAHRGKAVPHFGVLKLGTGNSVASLVKASSPRSDGFVDDVLRARSGAVPSYRTVDLLTVNGRHAPFAGLGMDGQLLNDYNWVKENLGQGLLSRVLTGPGGYFTSVAFKTVPYYLTHDTEVQCEVINGASPAYRMSPGGTPMATVPPHARLYQGTVSIAAAGTVPFYGYELKMFPFGALRRGHMHLRLGTAAATSILANIPGLWAGTWFPEGLFDFLAKDVTLRFSKPMPLQISGDAAGFHEEVRFQVSPHSIRVADFGSASRDA